MSWWPCAAGVQLLAQINQRFPNRDKSSDGAIGDVAHSGRTSDHNPAPSFAGEHGSRLDPSTPPGCVRARDIDEDFTGPDDPLANRLLAEMIASNDPRFRYFIFEGLIYSRTGSAYFRQLPYNGPNAHEHHIHISFSRLGDHDGTPFNLPSLSVKEEA